MAQQLFGSECHAGNETVCLRSCVLVRDKLFGSETGHVETTPLSLSLSLPPSLALSRALSLARALSHSLSLSLSLSLALSLARALSLSAPWSAPWSLKGSRQRVSYTYTVGVGQGERERERERERGRVIPPASQGREKFIDNQIDDLRTLAFSAHRQRCLSLENLTVALSCLSVSLPLCLSSSLSTMEGTPSYQLLCVTIFAFLFFA